MKISGFTMVKNATKLYYPVKESIESILPICDEFIVALGDCDPDDLTEQVISSIGSPKIKIVHTVWDTEKYSRGTELAHQTDLAKEACTGDWLFYIQSDEVVHEKYLPIIKTRCEELLTDTSVEGLLFHYRHFWGDYEHLVISHVLYPKEIRIIRNDKDIHSWRDAQSFRRIPQFNGYDYNQKEGTEKLNVAMVDAYIHHYGFVRPPHLMEKKRKTLDTAYHGPSGSPHQTYTDVFDYGNLTKLARYNDTHPIVLKKWVAKFDWKERLRFTDAGAPKSSSRKHEKFKYRVLTFIEQNLLGGRQLFGFKNFRLIKR
jgi:hypothetical protein